ncbi:hypothetical protein GCM10010965_15820 [Caldalkalibacillus thermarum]|uniref:flagellar assembly protein A n=1 Tax=Caldalkalibacillus thermarum TaxID=296745 RepID=UPI00166900E5|nr:FapA family protein [Caldalkalibacillus thermarum]GGK23883.1 hypothetical protein GCM10010965_15820 [Caldalkalibacillus thermarum]
MDHVALGDTVEEAVHKALEEKGWQREDVEIEVLDPGKRGIFTKRQAVVRIRKKQPGQTQQADHSAGMTNELNEENLVQWLSLLDHSSPSTDKVPSTHSVQGELSSPASALTEATEDMVWWEENRLCMNRELFENNVILFPPQRAKLLLNGNPLKHMVVLSAADQVTLHPDLGELKNWIHIETRNRDIEATIRLKEEATFELIPQLTPHPDKIEIRFIEQKRRQLPITAGDVIKLLNQKGIVYGINYERIDQWLREGFKEQKPYVIANGKDKQDGRPTQFKKLYTSQTPRSEAGDEQEAIDWFGVHHVPSVKAGEKIMEVIPASKGVNGINVYGQPIPAADGKEIPLRLGKGVVSSPDGRYVYATIDGRPEITKGKVSVNPLYVVEGDVSLETGGIKFHGDVLVTGDVLEGLSVEASGNVEIKGSVIGGKIVAGQHVKVVKNVIGSQVTAGGEVSAYQLLLSRIERILQQLDMLSKAYHQLKAIPVFKMEDLLKNGIGRLIKLLLESKLNQLETDIEQFEYHFKQANIDHKQVAAWLTLLVEKLTGLGPLSIKSITEIEELVHYGHELKQELEQHTLNPCHVAASYIQNSTVQASGSIYVKGMGVYNSKLYAADEICVDGDPGIVRGGYLESGKKIRVHELGVWSGVKSHMVIREQDGEVCADHLNVGVIISINGISYQNQRYLRCARLCYDPSSQAIKVISFSEKGREK